MNEIETAIENRREFIEECAKTETTAYRLFNGIREGIPGLAIDRLGDIAILWVRDDEYRGGFDSILKIGEKLLKEFSLRSIYQKRMVADRSHRPPDAELNSEIPLLGEVSPPEFAISENGIRFLVRPYDGYSTGLFLDQRNNRRYLAELGQEKTVLNTFAYTCGFSVACAKAGAKTTSVDISKKYLDWGRRNFEANQLSLEGQRFFRDDVLDFLRKEEQRQKSYDLVILDPPSFGRGDKKVFSLVQGRTELIERALKVLRTDGHLFFSCNYFGWQSWDLQKAVERVAASLKINLEKTRTPELPIDFQQEEHPLYAVTLKKVN